MEFEKSSQNTGDINPGSPGRPPMQRRGRYGYVLSQQTAPALCNIYAFVAAISVVGALAFLLVKPDFSETEKRKLAAKPQLTAESFFAGSYSEQADAYYSDTFPYREFLLGLGSAIKEHRGFLFDDVRIHEATPPAPTESASSTLPDEPPDTETPVPPEEDTAVGEQNGSVFIYKGKGLSMFGASQGMAEWYANTVNWYAETLPDVQVYDMVIPTHIEFALPEKYRSMSASQKENIDRIYATLSEQVISVDAYGELNAHSDEYLYFSTDHHWTMRGAYYAYVAFCKSAGLTPVALEALDVRVIENFLGTLYAQTQDSKLKENVDYVEYPMFSTPHKVYMYQRNQPYTPYASSLMAEYARGVNSYSVFLHGDWPLMQVITEQKNGRKIMVVKESFGNAFAPFLVHHYEEIYIVDQRYFQLGAMGFIQQHGINEIVFANNIFAANTPYHIQCIQGLMYQQFVPPEPEPEEGEQDAEPAGQAEQHSEADE